MATPDRDEVLRRRERLMQRSDQLRLNWSQQVQVLRAPLGLADQARAAGAVAAAAPRMAARRGRAVIVLLRPAVRCAGPAMPGRVTACTGACSGRWHARMPR